MRFLRLATNKSERTELSKKCKSLLDEAERIKSSEKWSINEEPLIDVDPSGPSTVNPSKNLARSPQPKQLSIGQGQWLNQVDVLSSEPVSSRALSETERSILSKSAKVNGLVYPQFSGAVKHGETRQILTGEKYK